MSSVTYDGLGRRRFDRPSATSCFIRQPLPFDADKGDVGSGCIIKSKRDSIIVSKIELREIPFQVLLADVMINTINPALQDREISFNGVGVRIATNVFLGGMVATS